MGETKLFKASKELNQLIRKMIHCFETPHLTPPPLPRGLKVAFNNKKAHKNLKYVKRFSRIILVAILS